MRRWIGYSVAEIGGQPDRDVRAAVGRLATRVREVYLHVDLDALDGPLAPGVVDDPVPGGLSREQLRSAIELVASTFQIRASTVACFDPSGDRANATRSAALEILEAIATAVAHVPAGARAT